MDNISLCTDSECPTKTTCRRWHEKYKPFEYQSYADFRRFEDKCEFYIRDTR